MSLRLIFILLPLSLELNNEAHNWRVEHYVSNCPWRHGMSSQRHGPNL